MIDIPMNKDFCEQAEKCKDAVQPCIVCGKPAPTTPFSIHVHCGGGTAVTEEEAAKLDEGADLGMYPIGRNCLKKHPELKEYAVRA
jgi:hypothetical protein